METSNFNDSKSASPQTIFEIKGDLSKPTPFKWYNNTDIRKISAVGYFTTLFMQKSITFDKDLLPPKLWFFLYLASLSCVTPYFSVFYRSVGLNSEQIGILGAVRPFINSFGGPLLGFIADKSHQHKVMLWGGILLSVLVRFLMLFANGDFSLICACLIISEFVGSAVTPLLDNSVLEILGSERVTSYGKQRMFGALGWGLAALIVGLLVSHFNNQSIFFVSNLVVGLMFFGAIAKFPMAESSKSSVKWGSIFKIFFYSIDTTLFFLIIFIMGLAVGIYFNFLFIFLKELGAGSLLMGVVLMVNSASDITFFVCSGTIIGKLGSRNVLHICLVAYALRIFSYSVIPSAWYVLPGELLQGFTWGLAWSAAVIYATHISPPGLRATTQGLVGGVVGLGNGFGALVGGFLYEREGAIFTFRATAALMVVALVVFVISGFFLDRYQNYAKLSQRKWIEKCVPSNDLGSNDEL